MRSFKNSLKAKAWRFKKWSRGVIRTLSGFHHVMEYIDMIDQRQMTANWDIEVLRKRIEDQEQEIKTLEYKLENLDIDDKIEYALDCIDVEEKVDSYLQSEVDFSEWIDYGDVSRKTLETMIETLSEHV